MSGLPYELEIFKAILQGGDPQQIGAKTINSLRNILETWSSSGGFSGGLSSTNFGKMSAQIIRMFDLAHIIGTFQGALAGKQIDSWLVAKAKFLKNEITQDYKFALGLGNKTVATEAVYTLDEFIQRYDQGTPRQLAAQQGDILNLLTTMVMQLQQQQQQQQQATPPPTGRRLF